MQMKDLFTKGKAFIERHERTLMPAFLAFGFLVDAVTLRRVDLLPETILVYAYLTVAAAVILLIHLHEEKKLPRFLEEKLVPLFPLALSYVFGSLFSAFLVFYVKSASIADSWPFLAVLCAVAVGWELIKKHQTIFVLHATLFFLGLLSFSIFATPLWTGRLGTDVFFMSLGVALAVFAVFSALLYITGKRRFLQSAGALSASVFLVASAVVFLYFTDAIPPIPLALKDIGVYHSVVREGDSYSLLTERESLLERLFGATVHAAPGESVYVFSSVFTPVAIQTDIIHRWEQYDEHSRKWIDASLVRFPVSGGREKGYRGFSEKLSVSAGRWRVSVETPDGRVIGRISFSVMPVGAVPALVEIIR
jgi:hypothetical protein